MAGNVLRFGTLIWSWRTGTNAISGEIREDFTAGPHLQRRQQSVWDVFLTVFSWRGKAIWEGFAAVRRHWRATMRITVDNHALAQRLSSWTKSWTSASLSHRSFRLSFELFLVFSDVAFHLSSVRQVRCMPGFKSNAAAVKTGTEYGIIYKLLT
jgi:hypothetical protein